MSDEPFELVAGCPDEKKGLSPGVVALTKAFEGDDEGWYPGAVGYYDANDVYMPCVEKDTCPVGVGESDFTGADECSDCPHCVPVAVVWFETYFDTPWHSVPYDSLRAATQAEVAAFGKGLLKRYLHARAEYTKELHDPWYRADYDSYMDLEEK